MKIYIAGKINGDLGYSTKFARAKFALVAEGRTVLNPANLPEGMATADYMRICFAMMDSADAVAFLPDYTESKGAMLEHAWCEYTGKEIIYLEADHGQA